MTQENDFDLHDFINRIMDENIDYKIETIDRLTPILHRVFDELGEKYFIEILSGALMKIFQSKGVMVAIRYSDDPEKRLSNVRTVDETAGIVGAFGHLFTILSSILQENPDMFDALIEESIEYEEELQKSIEESEEAEAIKHIAQQIQQDIDKGER